MTLLSLMMWTLGTHSQAAAQTIKIFIDGREISSDCSPVEIAGRTYVPLRVVSENLGAKVDWKEATQQVIINWHTTVTTSLPPGEPGEVQIVIDGQPLVIPADYGKPYINSQYRTMIPLRSVGEALGCQVNWIPATYAVDIRSKPLSPDDKLLSDLASYRTNLKLTDGSVINSADLMNEPASAYSAEQLAVFKTYLDQLSKYGQTVSLPSGVVTNASELSILGNSYLTAEQLKKWIISETPRIKANMAMQGLPFQPIPDLADLYIKIGAQYGIRGDIAFCQAAKETCYWQFTGDVKPSQNNYCGLWATGSPLTGLESYNGADPKLVCFEAGLHGAVFATPAAGVEAHIQHLYAYATKNPLPAGRTLIDPRFALVNRGIGTTWLGLNARWAVPGTTYGQSIIFDYWLKAVQSR
jgi:hypothetical protein